MPDPRHEAFVAGDAGYGTLAAADGSYEGAFTSPPRPPFWCRVGQHRWRVVDGDDFINLLACERCRKVRS